MEQLGFHAAHPVDKLYFVDAQTLPESRLNALPHDIVSGVVGLAPTHSESQPDAPAPSISA